MRLEWTRHHTGQSWQALHDGFIVGSVAAYGQRLRPEAHSEPTYWVAFLGRERLPGEYATAEEAKAAVEVAHPGP